MKGSDTHYFGTRVDFASKNEYTFFGRPKSGSKSGVSGPSALVRAREELKLGLQTSQQLRGRFGGCVCGPK